MAGRLSIILSGVPGRMAQKIAAVCEDEREQGVLGGASIVHAIARPGSPVLGMPLSKASGFPSQCQCVPVDEVGDDHARVMSDMGDLRHGVWIDFSAPKAAPAHAERAGELGVPFLTGTTGLGEDETTRIEAVADRIPVLIAANTSLGINLLSRLVRDVARSLGPAYDIEIVEAHHKWKKDAPSGTALLLGREAAAGRGQSLGELACHGREGRDALRKPGEIGFHALRMGDVVGEHRVWFVGNGERIELAHAAHDRRTFAAGAVAAARFLRDQSPGLYTMTDVLTAGG